MPLKAIVLNIAFAAGFLASVTPARPQAPSTDAAAYFERSRKTLSGYQPTPISVVEKMLELAQVRPNELVYDLGSGDGRIVIMAAQKFGARGVGIELDPKLSGASRQKVEELGLSHQVRIIEGDILGQDLSPANVVTIYIDPRGMEKLRAHLEKFLHHGLRVVVCDAEMPGWTRSASVTAYDTEKKAYKLNLYTVSRPGEWVSFSKFGRTP